MEDPTSAVAASWTEARALGVAFYTTGRPCIRGHLAPRKANGGTCTECQAARYRENPDAVKARASARYRANQDKIKAYIASWRLKNPDKVRAYSVAWAKANRPLYRELTARRRTKLTRATPDWLTPEQIAEMRAIYASTPKGYHVDHIVPLNGKTVCGLHVPWNLQLLPASENVRKSAKFNG